MNAHPWTSEDHDRATSAVDTLRNLGVLDEALAVDLNERVQRTASAQACPSCLTDPNGCYSRWTCGLCSAHGVGLGVDGQAAANVALLGLLAHRRQAHPTEGRA